MGPCFLVEQDKTAGSANDQTLVWGTTTWISGHESKLPEGSDVSSYDIMDQLIGYYLDKNTYPNLKVSTLLVTFPLLFSSSSSVEHCSGRTQRRCSADPTLCCSQEVDRRRRQNSLYTIFIDFDLTFPLIFYQTTLLTPDPYSGSLLTAPTPTTLAPTSTSSSMACPTSSRVMPPARPRKWAGTGSWKGTGTATSITHGEW